MLQVAARKAHDMQQQPVQTMQPLAAIPPAAPPAKPINGRGKKPWSKEEDDVIVRLVTAYGTNSWTKISKELKLGNSTTYLHMIDVYQLKFLQRVNLVH